MHSNNSCLVYVVVATALKAAAVTSATARGAPAGSWIL
jgi:hypothetical protein